MRKKRLSKNIILSPLIGSICTLLLAGSFVGCNKNLNEKAGSETVSPKTTSKKVAAMVNGKPIYVTQLDKAADKQLKKDRRFNRTKFSSAQIDLLRKRSLDQLIDQEVLRQASRKEPIADLDAKVKEEIKLVTDQFGSGKELQGYMASRHMTEEQFTTFLENKIRLNEYLKKEGVLDPDIPEEEIQAFYEQSGNSFKIKEAVKVSQILLKVEKNATPTQRKEILKKAQALRERVIQGEEFAEVAKEHSESAEAKDFGGDLGFVKRGYMPAAFDKVAFALKEGEISEPVATEYGYHIIQLHKKRAERLNPYEKVRDFIRKYLQERVATRNMDLHKKKLRQEATIKVISFQVEPAK